MDRIEVYKYLEVKKELLFPNEKYTENEMENAMMKASNVPTWLLDGVQYRSPNLAQKLSLLPLGLEKFYVKKPIIGFLKYITVGGIWVWWMVDLATGKARSECRAYNCEKLLEAIRGYIRN